jgi:quinol monooxygenase YgiN
VGAAIYAVAMPSHLVVARVHALVGRLDEARAVLAERQAAVSAEPGCERAEAAEVLGDDGELIVVQAWRDERSLRAHYASAANAAYQHRIGELLARPSDVVVHTVAGTSHPVDAGPPAPERLG